MISTSVYNANFKHWQDYDPAWIFKRPDHVSVVGIEQRYNSTYLQVFKKNRNKIKNAIDKDVKNLQAQYSLPN